jgi:spore maturation protein CgeB
VMLAGGFYLTEFTTGVASMLKDGEHCAFYTDAGSCISQIDRYLADATGRNEIKANGEAFVRAHHTYDQRIANLLGNREFVNPL